MQASILESLLSWLHVHPWGWLLVLGVLLLLFVGWMAVPFTWRDAEGDLVREGQNTANLWDSVLRFLS